MVQAQTATNVQSGVKNAARRMSDKFCKTCKYSGEEQLSGILVATLLGENNRNGKLQNLGTGNCSQEKDIIMIPNIIKRKVP
jgi:hypothetical protein